MFSYVHGSTFGMNSSKTAAMRSWAAATSEAPGSRPSVAYAQTRLATFCDGNAAMPRVAAAVIAAHA